MVNCVLACQHFVANSCAASSHQPARAHFPHKLTVEAFEQRINYYFQYFTLQYSKGVLYGGELKIIEFKNSIAFFLSLSFHQLLLPSSPLKLWRQAVS
jgi:hypothetical protein